MPEKKYLPKYKGCFICGQKDVNPATLGLRFEVIEKGVCVKLTLNRLHEGYRDVVHGGIICSLLDETMGWSVAVERKKFFITGELNVRFLKPLPTHLEITVKGHSVEHKSRYSVAEGEITDLKGTVYAKAWGKFFFMKDDVAEKAKSYLTFQKGDIDILSTGSGC